MPVSWPNRVHEPKDPQAVLDYQLDWSDWLAEGETIHSSEWEASYGAVVDSSVDGAVCTAWLSGGVVGTPVTLTNTVTTDSSPVQRVDQRSLIIRIKER